MIVSKWFLFLEPVQTQKIDKLLRRQYIERMHFGHKEPAENRFPKTQPHNFIVPTIADVSSPIWSQGTESCHIHEAKPQHSVFIINQFTAVMPLLLECPHDQSRTNAPNTEIELSVPPESDRCESIQKFAANALSGEVSPRITEVERQEPQRPTQFRLYQYESEREVARHLATAVLNRQVTPPMEDHLYTFSRIYRSEISSHVLKTPIRRSYSNYISLSKVSWYCRSPISFYARRCYQFL